MKPERNSAASTEGVEATGGEPQMVEDGMAGSSGDVNQRTTIGGDERASRGQSVRSSEEAGNERGAKGRRKVVLGPSAKLTDTGSDSAARLCVRACWKAGLSLGWEPDSGPPRWGERVGDNGAAGATHPMALSRVPEPVHRQTTTGKIRENRRFGLGGRGNESSFLRSSSSLLAQSSLRYELPGLTGTGSR